MLKNKKVILMAVSSSGGHIYPAVAMAEKLIAGFSEEERKFLEVHFVYPSVPLAEEILSSNPYPRHPLSLGGMAKGQKLFRKLKTLFQLPLAFFKSFLLIWKIKPDLILGTGGSVTVPLLTAGFLLRKKQAIWEGNTQMGLANKFLSVFTKPVFTAFPNVTGLNSKKQIWSAYPLRKSLSQSSKSRESFDQNVKANQNFIVGSNLHSNPKQSEKTNKRTNSNVKLTSDQIIQPLDVSFQANFSQEKFKVLILGGSQGSVFFNQVVSQAIEQEDWRKDIFIYHQTGERSFEWVNKKYQALKKVLAFPFTKNIRTYYQKL